MYVKADLDGTIAVETKICCALDGPSRLERWINLDVLHVEQSDKLELQPKPI